MKANRATKMEVMHWEWSGLRPRSSVKLNPIQKINNRLGVLLWTIRFKIAPKRTKFLYHINKIL